MQCRTRPRRDVCPARFSTAVTGPCSDACLAHRQLDLRSYAPPIGLLLASLFVAVGLTFSPANASAADAAAQAAADKKLNSALGALAQERERIAREKLPLSRTVARLEDQVARLRRDRDRLLKVQDASTIDLGSLEKQVESLAEQDEFVKARLDEFVRDFEGRLHIAETPRYEALTSAAKLAEKNVNLDAVGKRDAQIQVVRRALERIRSQIGGEVFAGEALAPEGVLTQGHFLSYGPTTFYTSQDGAVRGLVESRINAADPVVVPVPGNLMTSFGDIAANGAGELPLDPTLGKALKIEKARKSIGQYIADGGVVGYVILALGFAALVLTAFKAYEILGFSVAPHEAVDEILEEIETGSRDAALKRAKTVDGVAGEMLATGVRHAMESRSVLEELLFEKVLRVRPTLERFLPFLAITAAAAPLLGLLGTVIGMINTFQLITIFGTGDAKSLSSGISEALMTTALGLVVAIPTLILHGALSRMAKRKIGLLEELSVAFVNGIDVLRSGPQRF